MKRGYRANPKGRKQRYLATAGYPDGTSAQAYVKSSSRSLPGQFGSANFAEGVRLKSGESAYAVTIQDAAYDEWSELSPLDVTFLVAAKKGQIKKKAHALLQEVYYGVVGDGTDRKLEVSWEEIPLGYVLGH
jgi:hypothetical protein